MKIKTLLLGSLFCGLTFNVYAIGENKEITIYNQDLALIKNNIRQNLNVGINEVVFEEVSKDIIAQSVLVYGDEIDVIEQSLGDRKINYSNMLKENIGKKVKTVRVNSTTGKYEFDEARILDVDEKGNAILEFDYGIQANFDGEVVFDKIPSGLSNTPILKTRIKVNHNGVKNIGLIYLTKGFSWNANYVANIVDDKFLNLLGNVSIKNNSGSNYKKINLNLVAGDVNVVREDSIQPMLLAKRGIMNNMVDSAVIDSPESLNGNYIYKLPYVTDINDGEIKQISFINSTKVKYNKDNEIISSLYLAEEKNSFRDINPTITYSFNNSKESGLGEPLPKGKISFYDKDSRAEMQFIGESLIPNRTQGQDIVLKIGKNFDIFASGEFEKIEKVGERKYKKNVDDTCVTVENSYIFDIVYSVTNSAKYDQNVSLKQYFPLSAEIVSENVVGKIDENGNRVWKFDVKKGSEYKLNVKVNYKIDRRDCSNKIYLD